MPECVWLKAHAGVTGNALLMGAAIRQPSPPSRRKTHKKHAACQRLIRERSSVYNTAERNSKSLCSPRALSGGSPACWMHWSSLYTQHWLCVCVCVWYVCVCLCVSVCVMCVCAWQRRQQRQNEFSFCFFVFRSLKITANKLCMLST